jgi:hypothetical protein
MATPLPSYQELSHLVSLPARSAKPPPVGLQLSGGKCTTCLLELPIPNERHNAMRGAFLQRSTPHLEHVTTGWVSQG